MAIKTIYGEVSGEEGICPVCGSKYEYTGEKKILDNGGTNGWKCKICKAYGEEGFFVVFGGNHYKVEFQDGKRLTKDGVMPGKEGICPVCGTSLEETDAYKGSEVDDYGRMYEWECPVCGASGSEGYDEIFNGKHYNVCQDI